MNTNIGNPTIHIDNATMISDRV